jgi:hypothetical protein
MAKIAAIALTAFIASAGAAAAQTFYFGVGPDPYYAPRPYYGPSPYGPSPYGPSPYGPSPYGPSPYGPSPYSGPPPAYYGGPGYSREAMFYRPGRYRTWNGCQPGWTVQSGLCKPYRGY